MTTKLLPLLAFVCFFATNMSAQLTSVSGAGSQSIMQVDDYIASLRPNETQRNATNPASHVKSLIQDSHEAAYVYSGTVKLYGDNPVALFTDVASLGAVSSAPGLPKDNIEIITVKVGNAGQLSNGINVSSLTGFPSLKYVYIISQGNAGSAQIVSAVQNNNPAVDVFYKITLPN